MTMMTMHVKGSAQERWRGEALVATCALAEVGADTALTDYAAADAGANFILTQVLRPLLRALDGTELSPEAEAHLQEAIAVLDERFIPVQI